MTIFDRLAAWLDVRPNEVRSVVLSFWGAFLVIAFLVMGRSLREALYLTTFPVETLPYITAAVAALSVPTVALFARLIAGHSPQRVLRLLVAGFGIGIAGLWPLATRVPAAVVVFYLWVALGTLLVTSGFWLVTAELFAVRGAKRLFGLIGAGGTAGAMVMGSALALLTARLSLIWLIPILIVLLGLFFLIESLLPTIHAATRPSEPRAKPSLWRNLGLVWSTPHLRTIAVIVATATVASTLIDYQFKELARATLTTREALTGFFGAFYGWTGAVALVLQLFVSAKLMSRAGIAVTLAILPALLLFGSAALILLPSLAVATLVRGTDNSLRKSLHRSVLEVLYVPISAETRRKTKTFIDSVVDAVAEGAGAGIILLWVTFSGFQSRYLSVFVVGFALLFIFLSRRMGRTYRQTVTEQLRRGGQEIAAGTDQRDLLSVSFTHVDIRPALEASGIAIATADLTADAARAAAILNELVEEDLAELEVRSPAAAEAMAVAEPQADPRSVLRAGTPEEIRGVLARNHEWGSDDIPLFVRLLARDSVYPEAVSVLRELEERALPQLARLVRDSDTDFVIRRRIPRVLAEFARSEADDALLDALTATRFEVRYRAAIGLVRRRRLGLPVSKRDSTAIVWEAVRAEVGRERPVWELQRLLDATEDAEDPLVARRVGARGELSLEHTFRLLTLVLDPDAVRSAYRGITLGHERLASLALEYLDQALPEDVRERLWPFIGDMSARQLSRIGRPLDQVVSDLVTTGATLFVSESERGALRKLIERADSEREPGP